MIIFSRPSEFDKILLFSEMTKALIREKKEVLNISVNRYEKKMYELCGINSTLLKKEIWNKILEDYILEKYNLDEILIFEKEINRAFEYNKWKANLIEYLSILEKILQDRKIEFCIMWNNSFLYDRALYFFCKKNNIKYFILEQGYFRPFTLAFDPKGVNADASIIKEKNFYENIEIDYEKMKNLLNPEYAILKKDKKLLEKEAKKYRIYKLLDKLKLENNLELIDESILTYISNKVKIARNKKVKLEIGEKLKEDFIFIPFQVETDSQIILNSPKIKTMRELFEIVSKAVERYNSNNKKDIKAIFKTHPMDPRLNIKDILNLNKKYKNSFLITTGDTKEIIKKSKAVITINSTVGIEALCEYKPVITLGDAFYNINDIVEHNENYDKLDLNIESVLTKNLNVELINKFLYYLRFIYFKEIYWRSPDEKSIKKIINEVLNGEGKKIS